MSSSGECLNVSAEMLLWPNNIINCWRSKTKYVDHDEIKTIKNEDFVRIDAFVNCNEIFGQIK